MASLFSIQCSVGRLSKGYGSRILQSLILIDALPSACWEKEKKETARVFFFSQGKTHVTGCAVQDFCGC
jgi:hypothetical protein